jgi:hypothetical protein
MSEQTATIPTLENLRAQRDAILERAAQNKAENVRVFGSVARGDATAESDIDLLVTFHEGASLVDLSGLVQDLSELLGRRVDVISDHPGIKERLRRRIERDAVPL